MSKCRRTSRLILTVALALTTLSADALFSQERQPAGNRRIVWLDGREVVEGEVIVRYRSQSGSIERARAEFQADSDGSEAIGRRGAHRMRSRRLSTRELLATLRANPDVEFVEPNFIIRANAVANDPSMSSLWGLVNTGQTVDGIAGVPGADINAAPAWDITTGSRANVVAVIDTGIDFNHPDLAANMFSAPRAFSVTVGSTTISCAAGSHGYNVLNNTCVPADDSGHGTHVAGIIGAVGNNNIGVTGVNWTASLMAIKVLDASGIGTASDAIKAIEFAIRTKAELGSGANVRVLNASWGGQVFAQSLSDEINAANSADMLFVAAAGSDGNNNDLVPHYPASYSSPNVVSVGGMDNRGELAPFSNYGANSVHLVAPGTSTLSTVPNNQYGYLSGTSMAAPHVAGAAALVLARCPGLTTAQLKAALLGTVDPVASASGKTVTGGSLNAAAALGACGPPSVRVNGQSVAISVAAGATITVDVANGPGYVSDYVLMVPAGSPAQTWGTYKYLSGTTTRPATGLRSATLQFTAPSSGQVEFRFFQNDSWTLLATSPVVTVGAGGNPTPTVSSISPNSAAAGSPGFTVTVNGTGFVAASQVRVNGSARATTFVSATMLTASIPASDVASAGTLAVSVFNPSPGGGTSGNAAFTVTAPAATPTLRLNGGAGPVTVNGGSTIIVEVSNGPGYVSDYLLMVPAGSPAQTWGTYKYLSGSTTRPPSGMTSASVPFTAPSGGGQFEFRFYQNDTWTLLATSAVVTVNPGGASNPVPVVSSISPTSATAGSSAFTMTVTGSGFVAASQVRVNGANRATTFVSANTLTAAIPASDVASAGSLAISVSTPAPGGGTSGNVAFTVNAPSSAASVKVNGGSAPITVNGGSTIIVEVANGPGYISDYLLMVPAGSPANTWGTYKYLSGSTTRPSNGMTSASVSFTAPSAGGQFEFRFYQNDTWTLLATSPVVTVNASASNPMPAVSSVSPTSATAGSPAFTLTVTGSGFVSASQVQVNGSARATTFVSATTLTAAIPASDVASAGSLAISVTSPAPGGGTSGTVTFTVTAPSSSPTLRINGGSGPVTVSGGSTITVNVTNGPGFQSDYLLMVPAGSPAQTWGTYKYLSGTTTRPAAGMTSANVAFTAPSAGGQFEFRFYQNDTWTLLATSPVVTVNPAPSSNSPTLRLNGGSGPITVNGGTLITVDVSNGPGYQSDYVLMVPAGSPPQTWGTYKYLSGTTTRPATGMTSASLQFTAPTAGGQFEFRFFQNDTWTLLATSSVVTVTP